MVTEIHLRRTVREHMTASTSYPKLTPKHNVVAY
jgi:hypothetical protein